jgi:hypothetical protein
VLALGPRELTADDAILVHNGMTAQEVEHAFGRPPEKVWYYWGGTTSPPSDTLMHTWTGTSVDIDVSFDDDGRVGGVDLSPPTVLPFWDRVRTRLGI